MHNRIGPWHTLDVVQLDIGWNYSFTHPGYPQGECPDDCELRRDLNTGAIDILGDRFGDLPIGTYRIRSQWSSGLLQNTDGSDIAYPDVLTDLEPLDMDPDILEQLVDVGNAARNRHYHEHACGCREYPHSCAKNIATGIHDTDAFGISIPTVLAAYLRLTAAH